METILLKNIEAERVRHGLTKEALAEILGITSKTYLSWLRGVTEIPSGKIRQMKKMWNVSADYLLEISEAADPTQKVG